MTEGTNNTVMNRIEKILMGDKDDHAGPPPGLDDFLLKIQARGMISPQKVHQALHLVDIADYPTPERMVQLPLPPRVVLPPMDLDAAQIRAKQLTHIEQTLIAAAAIAVRNRRAHVEVLERKRSCEADRH